MFGHRGAQPLHLLAEGQVGHRGAQPLHLLPVVKFIGRPSVMTFTEAKENVRILHVTGISLTLEAIK